jgi:hypothetical protein
VRAHAVATGKGLYLATVDEPASGALFEPRVECGLAEATVALALPLGTELPSRVELRAYPDTLSADFPIAQVQAALLNGRGERLPPDALRLTAQRGSLELSPVDGALRGEYRGAAAVEAGGDTLLAAWSHPVGEGLAWELELSAAAADGGVLVALVRARDRQARPLPGAPVRVRLGELAVDAVTDARGWAKVLFPALPAEATMVRAETALGRLLGLVPVGPQVAQARGSHGRRDDLLRLPKVGRDRLFNQEIEPLGKQWQRHLRMQACGRRDHDGIGELQVDADRQHHQASLERQRGTRA